MVCENAGQVSASRAKNKYSFVRMEGLQMESEYSALLDNLLGQLVIISSAMAFWTVIADDSGGTYIRQVRA
jgi:hypothetical protein